MLFKVEYYSLDKVSGYSNDDEYFCSYYVADNISQVLKWLSEDEAIEKVTITKILGDVHVLNDEEI